MSPAASRPAFVATEIAFLEEDDTLVLTLVHSSKSSPLRYLQFQRALRPDEQDESLGMCGVHVELDSQKNSGYFEDVRAGISDDRLTIWLGGSKQVKWAAGGEIVIGLQVTSEEHLLLRDGLSRILKRNS